MSTSPARIEANRENAQSSTGPKTEAGKQRSALNSVKHGFTGQTMLLPAEEAEPYRAFTEAFLRELAPVGPHETHLAHLIMNNRWRLTQIAGLESAIYALGHREHANQFADETPEMAAALSRALTFESKRKELDRLRRYENSIARQVNHDTKSLAELQSARKAEQDTQEKEAVALLTHFTNAGKAWDPADYGLKLSLSQIEHLEQRQFLLRRLNPSATS